MKKRKIVIPAAAIVLACVVTFGYLFYSGILLFNNPSRTQYPVRGVDVSEYQGEIDWDAIAAQDIRSAFIKATEGSSYTDPYFHDNFEGAVKANLRVGAYHFFSFESGGATQADHFIREVSAAAGAALAGSQELGAQFAGGGSPLLPPVIDVELYGAHKSHPPARGAVQPQLEAFTAKVRAACGVAPILYATQQSYALYIQDAFSHCDIWIRNIFRRPSLPDGRAWTFWQYADRGKLRGFSGRESRIDLDIFSGTAPEFADYGR